MSEPGIPQRQLINAFNPVSAITKAHENSIIIPQIPSNFIDGDFLKDLLDFDPVTFGDSRACVFEFKEGTEPRGSTLNFLVRISLEFNIYGRASLT